MMNLLLLAVFAALSSFADAQAPPVTVVLTRPATEIATQVVTTPTPVTRLTAVTTPVTVVVPPPSSTIPPPPPPPTTYIPSSTVAITTGRGGKAYYFFELSLC